ncbi:MAG: hypothetical protein K5985_08970 [Lachnospiraceae bacterium]|nr:hypothetical protein [Lachnospiraceae bacterium]
MNSKIEQIIEQIEDYIDSCKYAKLSSTKILVNKDVIEDLLSELKARTPEEIQRYQKVLSQKESIMADAQTKAEALIMEAQAYSDNMINENTIMQQAYAQASEVVNQAKYQATDIVTQAEAQAQETVDTATITANEVTTGAMQYMDTSLAEIEAILEHTLRDTRMRYEGMVTSLNQILGVIRENRAQLHPEEAPADTGEAYQENPMPVDPQMAQDPAYEDDDSGESELRVLK